MKIRFAALLAVLLQAPFVLAAEIKLLRDRKSVV